MSDKNKINKWNFSIRDKLMLIIMSISTFALLLTSILFTYIQINEIRQSMADDLITLAQILGTNTQIALAFNDPDDAEKVLADLKNNSSITNAIIYDTDGDVFSRYIKDGSKQTVFTPIVPHENFHEFNPDRLHVYHNITHKTGILGSIFLESNLNVLHTQIIQNIKITIIIILIVLLICYVLTMRLQKIISLPILSLSKITNKIKESKDYNIRIKRDDYIEIKQLCNGFNAMLEQIQKNESELKNYQDHLEQRVEERTEEIKQNEKKILALNEDLEQKLKELKAVQKELLHKERLAVLGQLTATISHEIRNPLGTIKNCLTYLQRYNKDDNPVMEESIDKGMVNIQRCNNIINDLLSFARSQALEIKLTDFDKWLGDILDNYNVDSSIKLTRKLDGNVKTRIDCERMRRVIINLLDNACQSMIDNEKNNISASEIDRKLNVSTQSTDSQLEVSIVDTGVGIEPDDLQNIFEPFYSTKNFGTGLGLSIVDKIVKQHNGDIEVNSELGHGTNIKIWLPLNTSI